MIEFDNNADTAIDRIDAYVYGGDERLATIERDTDVDGATDVLERYFRTSDGATHRIDRDNLIDGTIDWVEIRGRVDGGAFAKKLLTPRWPDTRENMKRWRFLVGLFAVYGLSALAIWAHP